MITPSRPIATFALLAFAAAVVPAAARSIITDTFVATLSPAIETLEAVDDAALTGDASHHLRAFARRDSRVQSSTGEALAAWAHANAQAARVAAQAPTIDHLGPLFNLLNADAQPVLDARPTPDQQAAAAALRTAQGPAFDTLYVTTALPALERIEATEKDYILNGDDEALRTLAVHDLPRIERLAAELRKF